MNEITSVCPYCQTEMVLGEVRDVCAQGLYWFPEKNMEGVTAVVITKKSIEKAGGHMLGRPSFLGLSVPDFPEAYRCSKCGVVIIKP